MALLKLKLKSLFANEFLGSVTYVTDPFLLTLMSFCGTIF